jgi:imidazolonepropionase-like amidohydrolase
LHGSANPIGGQSALVKLRWGEPPARFPIEGADGFIKFALGENVKQSNAGDRYTVRYPQSRMGVEQTFLDAFSRARRYEQQKKEAGKGPFRRDLDLETISDVISGKRFITCHAYQQGEMTMLMNLADSFGFRVNTFTHVLEGYKIADRMKRHGVGASTFSDWWAYKFEVMEAIPHNASLMHRMGLVVAINSDDAEMGRRLNQEAAKSMKYGGLSSTEALALCTTNPARLLHLDKWTGTLEVGKDADLVLWSADPLSIASVVQQTWVDGVLRYSAERDAAMRKTIVQERQRLVQKALKSKKNGGKTEPVKIRKHRLYHCDDIERYGE